MQILTVNGGSSSIKFALFESGATPVRRLSGKIERIGLPQTTLTVSRTRQNLQNVPLSVSSQPEAVGALMSWLEKEVGLKQITAIGHRVVHGGPRYFEARRIIPE